MGNMRVFRDVDFRTYSVPQEQKPLCQVGHKALWEYCPEGAEKGVKGWLATWDSYVILGQSSGSLDDIRVPFDRINTVAEAMRAYEAFQGLASSWK